MSDNSVAYRQCQKRDWPRHKQTCAVRGEARPDQPADAGVDDGEVGVGGGADAAVEDGEGGDGGRVCSVCLLSKSAGEG